MIFQYIIDWKSLGKLINAPGISDTQFERIRGHLQSLREKIYQNGILISDDGTILEEDLRNIINDLKGCEEDPVYFNLLREMELYEKAYEDRSYRICIDNRHGSNVEACASAWFEHTRLISPQGVKGGVVITDERIQLRNFSIVQLEDYDNSEVEELRKKWSRGLTFNHRTRQDFRDCLYAFAAASCKWVEFVDPYWFSIGVSNAGGGETARQMRYKESTSLFLGPFVRNPDIERIDYITLWPTKTNEDEYEGFCCNKLEELMEKFAATRGQRLKVNITLLENEGRSRSHECFHNRFMINKDYTVALLNGMDICDTSGKLVEFQMILFGSTTENDNLSRWHIANFVMHNIEEEEVDVQRPYRVKIRDNPEITLSLNSQESC